MKRKILHILVLPKLAGVQRVSLDILKNLSNAEYEKWVLFSNVDDITKDKLRCQQEFEKAGVKVVFSDKLKREIGFSDWGAAKEIYRLCKREKFDIVHTHSTKPGIIGRIAASLAHVPLVVHTVHGLAFHKFIRFPHWQFYWFCEMFASLFCNKITMVNQFYGKYFGWCRRKVSTIYNGVDFSQFPEITHQKLDYIRVVFIGRLDTQKDPVTLLKAAEIVLKKFPEVKFTLVGDGEKYEECRNFIVQHHLSGNVELSGWQSDVSGYYANADIFVTSSIYEAFGLVFIEAAHYRLPVVATNVEGIPEVVKDKVTGLLSASGDFEAFACNIISLIENPALAETLGGQGRQYAHDSFTIEKMVSGFRKIYEG